MLAWENVSCPAAGGMLRIPFDFDRASVVARHEQMSRHATDFDRRGEVFCLAGNAILRPHRERSDFLRFPTAPGQTAEGQGGPHQLHPSSSRDPLGEFGSGDRKLSLQELAELGSILKLAQASPVGFSVAAFIGDMSSNWSKV